MKTDNIIQDKSFAFAVRVVKLYDFLIEERKEYAISKQLIRSGTAIGANIEEALGGQSSKDFIAKLSIAYKEARETRFWLRLLHATNKLTDNEAISIMNDAEEICKILGSILISSKKNNKI